MYYSQCVSPSRCVLIVGLENPTIPFDIYQFVGSFSLLCWENWITLRLPCVHHQVIEGFGSMLKSHGPTVEIGRNLPFLHLSPIIMVQWKITPNERKLTLEIHPFSTEP